MVVRQPPADARQSQSVIENAPQTSAGEESYRAFVELCMSEAPSECDFDVLPADDVLSAASKMVVALRSAIETYESASGFAIEHATELIEQYAYTLVAYETGVREAIVEYWNANGMAALDPNCECNHDDVWELSLRTLRGSPLATKHVYIRPRWRKGVVLPADFTLPVSGIMDRQGRYPRINQPEQYELTAFEIVTGVRAADAKGDPFNGFLGLWFTWDHHAESPNWILSRISIYNRPDSVGVVMPKF